MWLYFIAECIANATVSLPPKKKSPPRIWTSLWAPLAVSRMIFDTARKLSKFVLTLFDFFLTWPCEGFVRNRAPGPQPRICLALPPGVDLASIQQLTPEEGRARWIRGWGLCLITPSQTRPLSAGPCCGPLICIRIEFAFINHQTFSRMRESYLLQDKSLEQARGICYVDSRRLYCRSPEK